MKLMATYMSPYKVRIIFTMILKLVAVILELLNPYFLEYMVDVAAPKGERLLICEYGLFMVGCTVLGYVFNIVANRMATKTAMQSIRSIRADLFSKTIYLSGNEFDEVSLPSLISRMTSDSYNVQNFMGMIQRMGARAPIILIGGVVIAYNMDPFLTLILMGMAPVLAVIIVFISKKGIPLFKNVQRKVDKVVKIMRENISGIRVIKALSMTEYEKDRFREANETLTEEDVHAGRVMALPNPVMNLFLNVGLTCIILAGAYRVNAGNMQTGVILAFLTYFNIIVMSVMGINRIFISYSKAAASADRIKEVIDLPVSMKLPEKSVTMPEGETSDCMIEFENVSIEKMGVKNISFKIPKGKTLGVIGATGCGKTTLLNLMMRFYDVDEGRVLVDGIDVRDMNIQELRNRFGVVFQNDTIFNDTLYENISFGRNISLEDAKHAAKDAQLADYIESLGDGYDYVASIKGMNLSGGQRQRLLIARALAGNPEIIVLDDASSALDYKTDAALRKELLEGYGGIVKIVIAQRVSSVMTMDNILVMDEGVIVGSGNHKELMESCEIYRDIYRLQMGEV